MTEVMVATLVDGLLFDVPASNAGLCVQRARRGRREEICEHPFNFLHGLTFTVVLDWGFHGGGEVTD